MLSVCCDAGIRWRDYLSHELPTRVVCVCVSVVAEENCRKNNGICRNPLSAETFSSMLLFFINFPSPSLASPLLFMNNWKWNRFFPSWRKRKKLRKNFFRSSFNRRRETMTNFSVLFFFCSVVKRKWKFETTRICCCGEVSIRKFPVEFHGNFFASFQARQQASHLWILNEVQIFGRRRCRSTACRLFSRETFTNVGKSTEEKFLFFFVFTWSQVGCNRKFVQLHSAFLRFNQNRAQLAHKKKETWNLTSD